jgi:hypothetical protein
MNDSLQIIRQELQAEAEQAELVRRRVWELRMLIEHLIGTTAVYTCDMYDIDIGSDPNDQDAFALGTIQYFIWRRWRTHDEIELATLKAELELLIINNCVDY